MSARFPRSSFARVPAAFLVSVFVLALGAPLASAAPTVGFIEHWIGTGLAGWGGGDTYSNPGTGGVLGDGDGFLVVSTPGPSPFFSDKLGAMSSGTEYLGNWQAAGITQVRFWLNDVGADDPLELHFSLGDGTGGNFWQYDTGFIPALHTWTQFSVDLTSAAAFTHIIDMIPGGTFDSALQSVNRVLIRHDLAPYAQNPHVILADVGIDELLLTNGTTGVTPGGPRVAQPLQMAPPYPNPSRGAVALTLQTFDASSITVQVVDVMGRMVRHVTLASSAPGPRIWTWDGATDSGEPAPAGVYRVRAFGASGGTSQPLVRLAGAR